MRLIDANALQKWLDDYINEYNHGDWYGSAFNADWVDSVIDNAPTVDAAPVVHGKWIWTERGDDDYEQYWVCDKCGQQQYVETPYCPMCGAKMDGGNNAQE